MQSTNYKTEAQMTGNRRRKKKKKTINAVLVFLGILSILFTACMIWLFYLYQTVPDSLIVAVFGAIFGETSACALIKTAKVKNGETEDEHF